MFSVTAGVAVLEVEVEVVVAMEVQPDAPCVTPGLIICFLPMPARRRGLSNR